MVFRKHSKITGQATLEYFLIFSVIIAVTLVSASNFVPRILASMQAPGSGVVSSASSRMGVEGSWAGEEDWTLDISGWDFDIDFTGWGGGFW
jgi:hypothetical protein